MTIHIDAPTYERTPSSIGIGTARPRLSWKVRAGAGWRQVGYELEVTRAGRSSVSRVSSPDSVLVPWPGEPLSSREWATVRVRVLGEDGTASDWSAPSTVEAGLMDPTDWVAAAISPSWA